MTERTVPGTNRPIETYEDFFPYYLSEHSKSSVRGLHYFGTFAASAAFFGGLFTGTWSLVALAFLFGYGPAWVSHFFIEKNKPATFDYPLWSLRGDYHMLWLALTGKLKPALQRAGVID